MILHVKNKSYFVIAILKVENLKEAFSHFQMDSIVLFPEKSRKTSWHERYFRAKWNFLHQTPQISPIPSKIIFPRAALRKYCKRKSFYWVSVRGGAMYWIIGIFQWLISTAGPVLRFLTLSAGKSFDGRPLWQIVWVTCTFHGSYWIKKPDLLHVFNCSI